MTDRKADCKAKHKQPYKPDRRSADGRSYGVERQFDSDAPHLRDKHQAVQLWAGLGSEVRRRKERPIRADAQEQVKILEEYREVW